MKTSTEDPDQEGVVTHDGLDPQSPGIREEAFLLPLRKLRQRSPGQHGLPDPEPFETGHAAVSAGPVPALSRPSSAAASKARRHMKGVFSMKNLHETVFENVIRNYVRFGGVR